ncbi:MAG TPA: molybdopterin oxidoreductase family protein [Intrasporangium sp.]|uniref:molybdopterin oxidoreductase family protein n=1 Tax=Intrasporangium sp. TaxID=1925024 RepID=UPI002D7694A3|nr:molybdopterin oxidoreductase family protein [Intrasporangium sp.]HET7400048.1 molybdopterin oxidoreductase family protein [Intrasporangium sp.]
MTTTTPRRAAERNDAPGTATHCPYCGLQCAMTLTGSTPAELTVAPRRFPTNRGGLCQKGWTSAEVVRSSERVTTPLVRRDGSLVPTSWDEALDIVAAGIRRAQESHGHDAVAVFGGGGLTNEKAYQLGKFARVALRTSQVDYNGRWCMSSAAAAGIRCFGLDRGLPFPVTDLGSAHAILLLGANPAETMPPFLTHLVTAADAGGLMVADPRLTATAAKAVDGGGLHLPVRPGTDAALALGLLHVAMTERYADRDYIERRTTGFEQVWAVAAQWYPERTERVTGVSAATLQAVVRTLARARDTERGAYILSARGSEQHASGTDTVTAYIALALALGLPGNPGTGFGTITGQGNGQGGREHGQKADQLPGYRKIDDPAAREHVARVWGVDPADLPGPGRSAFELLEALGTDAGPKVLLVHGSNPVVSAPSATAVTTRLGALDLLVVSDFVLSETAALADVVLPVLQWAEEEGTLTNLEGRVLRRRRALPAPPGARSELAVWSDLAARLGHTTGFPTEPEQVFEELRQASAGGPADYSAVTYARLDAGENLQWPCSTERPQGTPRLFLDRFATPDGRARFVPVEHVGPAEQPDPDYPLTGTTGRVLAHYQSGAQTRRVGALAAAAGAMFVQVHPDTASSAGLADGDHADVVSRRGRTRAVVRTDEDIRTDTVFLPFHWAGDGRANLLTNPALDPVSRMPEFKACAVRLEAAS